MNKKVVALSILLLFSFIMCVKQTHTRNLSFSQELQDVLEKGLKATGGTGVSSAVIVSGQGQWAGTSGWSDPETSESVTSDMLFDIASAGKTFTSVLVLQLVEEGVLSLEDPLQKWLPEFTNINRSVTIRQLLNHTSGIAHFTENPRYWKTVFTDMNRTWTPEEILSYVPESHFPQGDGWHYSSTNYVLLGMIIEKATKSTLETQLEKRIFIPLKLKDTFTPPEKDETLPGAFAHAHFDLEGDGKLDDIGVLPRTSIFSSVWASGPVVTTAENLAGWSDALYGGRVLKKASFDQMVDFHRPTPGERLMSGYGLGTAELKSEFFGGERVWGHLGWQPGYMTAMLYFPDHSVSLVVLINDNNENCISAIGIGLWNVIKKHVNPNS